MDTLPTASNTPTLPLRPSCAGPIDLVPHWRRADREAAEARHQAALSRKARWIGAGHMVISLIFAVAAVLVAGACGWRP
ncbi:hypothetical protein VPG91_11670 [Nitrospirillum amazonense]|uniref:hypothetical protein n=1 Tax=Nitrospirillum amazonense TaxID=28077 RepID=UPI002DD43B4E|nr:hypothetical protein [Nitrospirillum amazonense]MEC4591648.1 hypothetical protein [Nitrospirillum amazonense]